MLSGTHTFAKRASTAARKAMGCLVLIETAAGLVKKRDRMEQPQHDSAGFCDFLVAGGAAELPSEDRDHREGAIVPLGGEFTGAARQRLDQ